LLLGHRRLGFNTRCLKHRWLGHPSSEVLSYLPPSLAIASNANKIRDDASAIYFRAKQTHSQFPISRHNATNIFSLIHYDIWGPYKIPSLCGAPYFLSIVDDASRGSCVYLMKDRTEGSKLLKRFIVVVKNQFNKGVEVVRSDSGAKFTSGFMQNFLLEHGILRETSYVDTTQQMEG